MKNRKIFFGKLLALLTMAVSPVYAMSTFDFALMADTVPGEGGAQPLVLSSTSGDPLTVTATGWAALPSVPANGVTIAANGNLPYHAYLDSSTGAGPAGLGVCKILDGSDQCTPSSDDNVIADEVLQLVFEQEVILTDIEFINGDHRTTFDPNAEVFIRIDLMDGTSETLENMFVGSLTGTVFEFWNLNAEGDNSQFQFYLNTITATVPLPAAAWLFISGLCSLGFFRKKATGGGKLTA